jgi:hypothetical protein
LPISANNKQILCSTTPNKRSKNTWSTKCRRVKKTHIQH